MIQFETILQELGSIGVVQVIFCLVPIYFIATNGLNALATVFIAYTPDVRCNVPPLDNATIYPNLTETDLLNLTTPYDPTDKSYDGCHRFGYDLNSCNGNLSCVDKSSPIISCDQGYYYDKSIFTETIVTEFDMICERNYLNTLSTSLFYAGNLIASLIFGNFADAYGRKICCVIAFLGVLGCMFGLSFSHSAALYIILRMGIAVFSYGAIIGTYVYIVEIVGKEWRTLFTMLYQIGFSLGTMVMTGIAYNWRDWHEMTLVATLLSVPYLFFAFILPESPRWLFTKGKNKEGIKVVKLMARINKVELSEESLKTDKKENEENTSTAKTYSSLDLFKKKRTRLITFNVMFNWLVNSFVYYGLSLNAAALSGDLFVNNTLNGVMETASYVICILLMDKIGRRIMLSASLFIAGITLLGNVVVNTYAGNNQSLITFGVVLSLLGKLGISGSFAIIYNVTSELYPTVLRSNGVAVGSVAARIGGIAAPFVILIQDYVEWLPNTIFGILGIAAAILSLFFPETNNQPIMESLEEAEEFYKSWNNRNKSKTDIDLGTAGHTNEGCESDVTRM